MEEGINFEKMWKDNDLRIEVLSEKMKMLRADFLKKKPDAKEDKIMSYINRKLKQETSSILDEQIRIIYSGFREG